MQLAVDAVGGDDRHVHEHPEAMMSAAMEICCSGMSSICMPINVMATRQRNGRGQHQRRTPIHQEQRHDDHDDHRLDEALHEVMDAMLDGRGLVGEHPELQAFGRARFHRFHHLLHVLVEMADDFAIAHFDRDHHGARACLRRAHPVALTRAPHAPEDIHLVRNGRLIHAADFEHVAQIDRRAFAAQADHRAEHVVLGLVFAGKLHREIASLGAHRAAGDHRVARAEIESITIFGVSP